MKRINLLNDVNDFIYLLKNVNSLKFRKWFKYGLKAQKLLAQGIALGIMANSKTPCKGKSFIIAKYFKAFALTGRVFKIRIKIWYKKWCYIGVFKLLILNT